MSDVDQDDVIDAATLAELGHTARMAEVHTAIGARVISRSGGTVDVRPLVQRAVPRVDGGVLLEDLPVVRSVPIVWPRGGGFFVELPLEAGDDVLLVCSEADLGRYLDTGEAGAPIDHRRHHLASAVAFPGLVPFSAMLADTDAIPGELVLGKVGSGPLLRISGTTIKIGRNAVGKAANADALGSHLDAIAATLAVLAAAITPSPIPEPTLQYGPTAKALLDISSPVPATVAEVE